MQEQQRSTKQFDQKYLECSSPDAKTMRPPPLSYEDPIQDPIPPTDAAVMSEGDIEEVMIYTVCRPRAPFGEF
jgi:hypothetical protein